MEQIEINVTKNIEEVEINVQPNVTQVIISEVGGGGVQSVQAGTNVTVDNTDPQNPIVSATGGGGLDQDNLPIKIDLTLADLGLTEIGTDEEMNTALKAYFTANNLTVTEKQIPHIRIFDELPSAEPYLRLEFDDLDAFVADRGGFDKNSLIDWNDDITDTWYFGQVPAVTSDFTNLEINGNEVILSGGQTGKDTKVLSIPPDAGLGGYLTLICEIRNFESLIEFQCEEMYSNPLIVIQNSPLLENIFVAQNDFTASRFDENFKDFAENTTVTGGQLEATGTAENISGTDAIAEFTAKTWTINID